MTYELTQECLSILKFSLKKNHNYNTFFHGKLPNVRYRICNSCISFGKIYLSDSLKNTSQTVRKNIFHYQADQELLLRGNVDEYER